MAERTQVAVVGGGISGLAAAHTLFLSGTPFVLLEATGRLGGVIRSEHVSGFLLEGGPDTILAQKPHGLTLCARLGLLDRLVPTNPTKRTVYVLHRRKLHPLPEGMMLAVPTRFAPLMKSGLFSWPGKLRMALELLVPPRRDGEDESIGDFVRRRFGVEAVERLGEPLLAGIHAGDPYRLSIRATFPRFAEIERRQGSLIGALRAAPPQDSGSPFYSLVGGLSELVGALSAVLPHGSARTGCAVVGLLGRAGGYTLELGGGGTLEARSVVLALPPPRAAPLLDGILPDLVRPLLAIPFASSATVLLGYRREDVAHPLDGYGLLVPRSEGLRTTALSFFSTKFPGRAPEGHVLLRGFLGGTRDTEVLSLSDDSMRRILHEEMGPILGLRADPVMTRVYRWPFAIPQMEVGHLERVAEVDRRIASLSGLFLTGAGLRVTGLSDCIADASCAAEAALESIGQPQRH